MWFHRRQLGNSWTIIGRVIRDGEEHTLLKALFRREPAAEKGQKALGYYAELIEAKGPKISLIC